MAVPARTKAAGTGPWREKLNLSETEWTKFARRTMPTPAQQQSALDKCQELINEAHILIQQDPLYLPSEALDIINKAYDDATKKIFAEGTTALKAPSAASKFPSFLGEKSQDELENAVAAYDLRVNQSLPVLTAIGIIPG